MPHYNQNLANNHKNILGHWMKFTRQIPQEEIIKFHIMEAKAGKNQISIPF